MSYAQRTARDLTDDVYRLLREPIEPTRRRAMIQERAQEVIERVITDATTAEQLRKESE